MKLRRAVVATRTRGTPPPRPLRTAGILVELLMWRVNWPAESYAPIFRRASPVLGTPAKRYCSAWFSASDRNGTEGFFAFLARTKRTQVIVTENSGGVAVGEADLYRVVTHGGGGLSLGFGLVHGQRGRSRC